MGAPKYLYHFSEEAHIDKFVPRQKYNRTDMPPVVWAIDGHHEVSYYFPRACPRIVVRRTPDISELHQQMFFLGTNADTVITVQTAWYQRIARTGLYRYTFRSDNFQLFDAIAGYYVSYQTELPVEVERMEGLFDHLLAAGVEIRMTPDLYPLRQAILGAGLRDFGIHCFE